MNKLYEILEICLNEMENGADVDTVLLGHPGMADELRPILEASLQAKELSAASPSPEVLKRNKVRLLQKAAEMREFKAVRDARRGWSVPLRRFSAVFTVLILLFASSTGLVSASSNTVPGDSLYSVKRSWENFTLFFTFDTVRREELELEFEHERLEELHELFTEGRSEDVDFSGYVTRQTAEEWRVSGVTVLITAQTRLPQQAVIVGDAIFVQGQILSENVVAADRIELLPEGAIVPEVEDTEFENEESGDVDGQLEAEAGEGSGNEAPESGDNSEDEKESIEGDVSSVQDNFIVVDGIVMDISFADVEGVPSVGASVEVEGYYDANGIFIVEKIKFKTDGEDSSSSDDENELSGSEDDSNDDDNSNDDDSGNGDDDSNSNDNDDNNDDD